MKQLRRTVFALGAALALASGLLAGCGKAGAPTAPGLRAPVTANGMRARGDDPVGDFYGLMRKFGYKGIRKRLEDSVTAVTQQAYITGWDTPELAAQRYAFWQPTFSDNVAKDLPDYTDSAVRLANYRFKVIYYVWVSRQDGNMSAPPDVDFNKNIPIVKGIEHDTNWIVQLSDHGTVLDFLELPPDYDTDLSHLIPIPRELY
jgi:hypothetical protein